MGLTYETRYETQLMGDMAADMSTYKWALFRTLRQIKIIAVRFGAAKAVTAADTNYSTFSLSDGTNTIASLATGPAAGGDSIAQGAFISKTPVAAYAVVAAGTTLQLVGAKTGSGMAISGLIVQIEFVEYGV